MKSDHLNADQIAAYRQRQLPPNELLAASDHLAGCAECRAHLLRLAPAAAVDLTYEELAAWVDDELEPIERREMQAKLLGSPGAGRELADLVRFKAEMNQLPAAGGGKIVPVFFGRWALPLAAAIALSLGGLWWGMHARSSSAGLVRLRDGGRDLRITRDGCVFKSFYACARRIKRSADGQADAGFGGDQRPCWPTGHTGRDRPNATAHLPCSRADDDGIA